MDNKDTDAKSQATSAPTAFLVDLVSNRKIPITTPRCRVGRDDLNDIVITGDQSISRFHFIINKEESQYSVQDAKSRHGTFLNGNQITGPEPINDGDVLKIGVSLFWFVIETPATAEGDTPSKGEPEKAKIVLNPSETGVTANGATQDINQLEIIDKLTSLTEAAEAKSDEKDEADAKAEEAAKEEAAKKEAAEKEAAEKEAAEKEAAEKEAAEKEAAEKIAAEKEAAEKEAAEKEAAEKEAAEKEAAEKEAAEKEAAEKEAAEKEAAEKEAAEKEAAEKEAAEKIAAEKEAEEKAKSKKEQEETSAKPDRKNKKGDKGKDDKEDEKSEAPEVSVKDLLDPLHDEIAALREKDQELIKEALEKADYNSESKDETESQKESEAEVAEESENEDDKEAESESKKETVTAEEQQEESEDKKDNDEEKSEDEAVLSEKSSQHDTLDRFADIIESSDSGKNAEESKSSSADSHEEEREMSELTAHDSSHISSSTRNGAEEMTIQGPSTVPDWCKRYFADELKGLNKELDELNDQIRKYQDKIKDIEGQASLTKGIRNTLLVSEGDELIDACKKVLGLIGWNVTQSEEDKNELLLEGDDQKVTIARIIWTNTNAERSHLGQLSISQTRYWCEKGKEPKGVLIVSKVSDKAPTSLAEESDEDFTDFASKKNVCLMSTLQLLSLYRESALKNGKNDELREAIYDSKGWLKGYKLEPGDNVAEEPAGKSLSSLLSS